MQQVHGTEKVAYAEMVPEEFLEEEDFKRLAVNITSPRFKMRS